jgi:putative ABC transport system permease protein
MISYFKHAVRQLVKSPGFTIISLLTLALGIGVNTTAFTVLNRLLLQPSPFPMSERLVEVIQRSAQGQDMTHSPGEFLDEQSRNKSFEHLAAYFVNPFGNLVIPGRVAQQSTDVAATADYFSVLGISPLLGRGFIAGDTAQHASVVVLSNAFWQREFGGNPEAIGRTLRFDGVLETIVGIMPAAMDDPTLYGRPVDLWKLDDPTENRGLRDKNWYSVAGRLKPGVTLGHAQAEMEAIAAGIAKEYPKTDGGQRLKVMPYRTATSAGYGVITWMMMDLNLVVLLIVCGNLGNLQLARNTGRAREFAIRLALGSSRSRLVRMLLFEALLLSTAGGALGLLVADWVNKGVAPSLGVAIPLNTHVIAFAFAISTVTSALFGTLPAWIASRADLVSAFKLGTRSATADRSRHRVRSLLISGQLAMTLVLLTCAGYFVRGLEKLTHDKTGWSSENLLVGSFSLSHERYGEDGDKRSAVFGDGFLADLQALPGAQQAVLSRSLPLAGPGSASAFLVEGQAIPAKGKEPLAAPNWVSPAYFAAFGIHLEQGRIFTTADRAESPRVAIVSHSMARKFWPGENPIGKRIGSPDASRPDWCEVVGVVNDIDGLGDNSPVESHYEIYRPWAQESMRFILFELHTNGNPDAFKESVRKVLAKIEPDVAISQLGTIDEILETNLSSVNAARQGLIDISILGLVLSFAGIYGVIANLASERTREVGIRMALGAQSRDVLRLFLRSGIRLAVAGTGIGLLLSSALMVVLTKFAGSFPGNDPWVVVVVTLLLVGVSLVACWIPALRATKVDPNVALRAE